MTSDGYLKGYKCRNCGHKDKKLQKVKTAVERSIKTELIIPPEQAQRHLVKPFRRYDLETKTDFRIINNWWKVYSKA